MPTAKCRDDTGDRGTESFGAGVIDSEPNTFGRYVDDSNKSRLRKTRFLPVLSERTKKEVHKVQPFRSIFPSDLIAPKSNGKDLKVGFLTRKSHAEAKNKLTDLLKKAASDILSETIENELQKKVSEYIQMKEAAEINAGATAEVQEEAFEDELKVLPPPDAVTVLHGGRQEFNCTSYYYADDAFPKTSFQQELSDNRWAFVIGESPIEESTLDKE